jgi:hypothetical protein
MWGVFKTTRQRRLEERRRKEKTFIQEAKADKDLVQSHRTAQSAEVRAVEEERRCKVAEKEAAAEKNKRGCGGSEEGFGQS